MNNYTVKAVKFHKGHDGYGMNCDLCRNGKKVAHVFDDAWGGEFMYTWVSREEEDKFNEYILTLPKWEGMNGEMYNQCPDIAVNNLVTEYEFNRKLKRQCKKKTAFKLKSQDKDEYFTIPHEYCEKVKEILINQHGEDLEEVYNERFI